MEGDGTEVRVASSSVGSPTQIGQQAQDAATLPGEPWETLAD
jgi:hypothetical protein